MNDELFGDGTGMHQVGKGTVYAGQESGRCFQRAAALRRTSTTPSRRATPDSCLFIASWPTAISTSWTIAATAAQTVDATFRVTGKAPELWHAETGKTEPASYKIADGRTTVPLKLEPWGTVFVVFRKATTQTSRTLPDKTETRACDRGWAVDGELPAGPRSAGTRSRWTSLHPGAKTPTRE